MSAPPQVRQMYENHGEEILSRALDRMDAHGRTAAAKRQRFAARRIVEQGGPLSPTFSVAEGLTLEELREEMAEEFQPVPSLSNRQVYHRYVRPAKLALAYTRSNLRGYFDREDGTQQELFG